MVDTNEPVKIATKERIVSEPQGKALEKEAKVQGYKSLDHKLKAMTGKPVGPTIKYVGGKATKAAANGLDPNLDQANYSAANMLPGAGLTPPGTIPASDYGMSGVTTGNWQKVPEKDTGQGGTIAYSKGGAIKRMAMCADGGVMRPQMRGFADGGEVDQEAKKAAMAAAIAYGKQFAGNAQPVAPASTQATPTSPTDGGVVAQTPAPVKPAVQRMATPAATPGTFDDTLAIARAAKNDVADAYNNGNLSGAWGRAMRGAAATGISGIADVASAEGRMLRPIGNAVSNAVTGEDLSASSAPQAATPTAKPAPTTATNTTNAAPGQFQPSKEAYPSGPATVPGAIGTAARLMGSTGKDVGGGVTRFDVAGKNPLFTNMTDASGMASNDALLSRGAVTPQNQGALDALVNKGRIGDMARAQYDAQVADAKRINGSQPYDAHAGADTLNDPRSPESIAIRNLNNVPRGTQPSQAAQKMAETIANETINRGPATRAADMGNATTQRGQDITARGQDINAQNNLANQRLAQGELGLKSNAAALDAQTKQRMAGLQKQLADATASGDSDKIEGIQNQIKAEQGRYDRLWTRQHRPSQNCLTVCSI